MKSHKATLKYLHIAPRKVRLVGQMLKGLSINEAEAQLLHMRRRPAGVLLKLLRSAVAGAKAKHMKEEKLFVKSVRTDGGPMLKRYLPRAMGRATPIQKKMSHVVIEVVERDEVKKQRFVIIKPKKLKKELVKANEPEKTKENEAERTRDREKRVLGTPKKRGFLKKIFSRKSV